MADVVVTIPGATNVTVDNAPASSVVVIFPASNNFVTTVIDRGVLFGVQGPAGATGPTGPTGPQGPVGEGLPVGGAVGDLVRKKSTTDYDTEWFSPNYATTTQLATKQDTLVSGTNIKTINGTSVLGSGDIVTSVQLAYRHDFNVYDYLGKAPSGSSEGANVWTITRLTIASDGTATVGTATNVDWTNRYTHTYS